MGNPNPMLRICILLSLVISISALPTSPPLPPDCFHIPCRTNATKTGLVICGPPKPETGSIQNIPTVELSGSSADLFVLKVMKFELSLAPVGEKRCFGKECQCENIQVDPIKGVLIFKPPPLYGRNQLLIHLDACKETALLPFFFTFEPPVLSRITPSSISAKTPEPLEITGFNFGSDPANIAIQIESNGTWVSLDVFSPQFSTSGDGLFATVLFNPPAMPKTFATRLRVCSGLPYQFSNGNETCSIELLFTILGKSSDDDDDDDDDKPTPTPVPSSFNWRTAILLPCLLVLAFFIGIYTFRRLLAKKSSSLNLENSLSFKLLESWDDHWNIDSDEVEFGECVGQGGFAVVYKGLWRGSEVAIKLIKSGKLTEEVLADFGAECRLMSSIHHPKIVQLYGASSKFAQGSLSSTAELIIVTEFLAKGSLSELLIREPSIPWHRTRINMLLDAAQGMMYLHNRANFVIHRDLKPANLLVDKDYNVKIADFGLSRIADTDQTMTACGTPKYAAPEVLNHTRYTKSADVWSFGVIIWELNTRTVPYEEIAPMQVAVKVAGGGHFLDLSLLTSPAVLSLVEACLMKNPEARPTFDQIVFRLTNLLQDGEDDRTEEV